MSYYCHKLLLKVVFPSLVLVPLGSSFSKSISCLNASSLRTANLFFRVNYDVWVLGLLLADISVLNELSCLSVLSCPRGGYFLLRLFLLACRLSGSVVIFIVA